MAFRVWIGSVAVDCDTPEEAIELAKRAEGAASSTPRSTAKVSEQGTKDGSRWTEKRVSDFLRLVEGDQRKLLDTLLEHADGRTDDQLLQFLSLRDGRQLAGVLSGLVKNTKKVGADPSDLYIKKPATIGGKRVFEYFLSESFRRALESHTTKT